MLETVGQFPAVGTPQPAGLLPVLVASAVAAEFVRGACSNR